MKKIYNASVFLIILSLYFFFRLELISIEALLLLSIFGSTYYKRGMSKLKVNGWEMVPFVIALIISMVLKQDYIR